jgi:hypothetical protein
MNEPTPSPSDWATLWDQQQAQNRAFVNSHHQLTAQMADIAMSNDATIKRLDRADARMSGIEIAVAENTNLTRDIRDAIIAARLTTRIVRWVAPLVVAAAGAWAAIKGWGRGE